MLISSLSTPLRYRMPNVSPPPSEGEVVNRILKRIVNRRGNLLNANKQGDQGVNVQKIVKGKRGKVTRVPLKRCSKVRALWPLIPICMLKVLFIVLEYFPLEPLIGQRLRRVVTVSSKTKSCV